MTHRLTYRDAGVDIEAARTILRKVHGSIATTFRPEVLSRSGGFSGLFQVPPGYNEPVLVAAADGVGTKVLVAAAAGQHKTVGIDLVAMSVNDIIVQGAEPLFFLDYIAMGSLDHHLVEELIDGMVDGCRMAGCSLIGGETAEMPGLYEAGHYDLAGMAVGVVERSNVITGDAIAEGNLILGLPSTGLHSNGFSLVRKALLSEDVSSTLESTTDLGYPLGEALLRPTAIYVRPIRSLLEALPVHGLLHITGGGFFENIPRVVPEQYKSVIVTSSWARPPIFDLIQGRAGLDDAEMYQTFNMGIGMLVLVAEEMADAAREALRDEGLTAQVVGRVEARQPGEAAVILTETG